MVNFSLLKEEQLKLAKKVILKDSSEKRNLIGWYASLFDVALVSAMNIVFTLADKSLFMIILTVVYAFFGFYIFKNKDYFTKPIKGRWVEGLILFFR